MISFKIIKKNSERTSSRTPLDKRIVLDIGRDEVLIEFSLSLLVVHQFHHQEFVQ